jgi:acyl dehydratase
MKLSIHPTAKYWEEFHIGDEFISPARTVSEADVVNFAGVSGDFNPLHSDRVFASGTIFGERISQGLLVLSIATGAMSRLGFLEGTVEAFLGLNWRFIAPVKIDDTVHVRFKVKETKESKRPGHGILVLEVTIKNQKSEAVQQGDWHLLVRKSVA